MSEDTSAATQCICVPGRSSEASKGNEQVGGVSGGKVQVGLEEGEVVCLVKVKGVLDCNG